MPVAGQLERARCQPPLSEDRDCASLRKSLAVGQLETVASVTVPPGRASAAGQGRANSESLGPPRPASAASGATVTVKAAAAAAAAGGACWAMFGHGPGGRPEWTSTQDPASESVSSLCPRLR